jgi:hypothetical protein
MPAKNLRVIGAVAVTLFAPAIFAWGAIGHRIVADLAQRQLNPKALAEVHRLLKTENASDLADVASWPDELRDSDDPAVKALGKQTAKLHYMDFKDFKNDSCEYQPARDCPDGLCVVKGLRNYVAVLADPKRSDKERREALSFVVHFVGDIHQPLHAGDRDDKGGNDYQVQFNGKGTNLHKVWDSGMLYTRNLKWPEYATRLAEDGPVVLPPATAPLDDPYAQWAEESCRITRDDGVYPKDHVIDDKYVAAELPIAETRLKEAGKRLADLLNTTLGK